MPVSTTELNEFLSSPKYARFVHTNLHLHTPATPWDWDSRENQTTNAASITPETYFEALSRTSLELVAITDHNSVNWCQQLVSLAKRARQEGKCNIHVLPGVEITTYEGPHLLAVFDESKEIEEIRLMIVRLGMSGRGDATDRVGDKSGRTMAIEEILSEVDKLGGMVIAPHVNEKDGLWGPREFKGRNAVLNDRRIRILAAPSGEIKRVKERANKTRLLYKNMDNTQITNSFGFINVSDCHRLEDFELNTTWIKMTTPGLEGVRQVIYEPELRVAHDIVTTLEKVEYPEVFRFARPTDPSHLHIIGISITGGMLNGLKATFSPHQNCIIGRNYAGKSALLDCLRFVLNVVPAQLESHDKFADRMRAFVGDGGEVRVYIRDAGAKVYGISRIFSSSRTGRSGKLRIDGIPDVFQQWGDEFRRESDLSVDRVFPLEIYPQGEVVRIKDNVNQQMKIIDALANVETDLQQLINEDYDGGRTILGKLVDNRREIVSQTEKRDKLIEETSGIQGLKDEISQLEALSTSESYAEKKRWADIEVKIDAYLSDLLRLQASWLSHDLLPNQGSEEKKQNEHQETAVPERMKEIETTVASPDDFSNYAIQVFKGVITQVFQGVGQNREALKDAIDRLKKLEVARKQREDDADAEIRKNLKAEDTGAKGDVLIGRITEKTKRLNDLLGKERDLETAKKELISLSEARENLIKEFDVKWGDIHTSRLAVVEMIQAECGPSIKAELIENVDEEQYRRLLDEIAEGLTSAENRIQRKETQLNQISSKVAPEQLADVVKKGDANELIAICPDVTPNTARVLLGMGPNAILQLEECRLGDRFVISYMRYGDTVFTRVDSGLSGGEQALALISVAMVPKPLPLVIDQPEDELGPALITYELVEQIRNVKTSRQLIFVTHVANIPVLADSEQVIYIEQEVSGTAKTSCLRCCGSLDQTEIVKHLLDLDGGVVAFEKRSQRYSSVMRSGK